jgi:ubiquitin-protein ligase
MTLSPEQIIRNEWDLLKKNGLLSQIGGSAGPKKKTNLFEWNALIVAPKNSPYNGYMFQFEIIFPKDYPAHPPTVRCKTNVYHMNISSSGDVCVSSIKNNNDWKNAFDISSVLFSIFIIFSKPNPGSPYNRDIADLYNSNRAEYERKVKEHCARYAMKIS